MKVYTTVVIKMLETSDKEKKLDNEKIEPRETKHNRSKQKTRVVHEKGQCNKTRITNEKVRKQNKTMRARITRPQKLTNKIP